jgi:putative ABC transport system permease protein
MVPQRPFMYVSDESFSTQYEADQHFGKLFTFFCLAICIACLGLFGLSTFAKTA